MDVFDQTALDWHERITQSISYRADKFDDDWKNIIKYTEIGGSRFSDSDLASSLLYDVRIPHVKINTQRKVALLSGSEFFPVVESDAADLPNHQTVVQMALRWGWRQARADSILTEMMNDFITLSIAGGQCIWDKYALDGRGAPRAMRKDMASIYFDPNRRQVDVNVDCRWIIERQMISFASAREKWPNFYTPDRMRVSSSGRSMSVDLSYFYKDEEKIREKDGYVDISRVEFINYVDGQRRVYEAIMDMQSKQWVVAPVDNGIGRYSYFFMSLPLRRGHAYPDVDILPETEMSDMINGFLSIYMEDAARTAANEKWVKNSDIAAKKSVADPRSNLPGAVNFYDEAPPTPFVSPRATKALEAAQALKLDLQELNMMPSVLTGNAPQGVRSGRAIDSLKSSAETPMKTFSLAQYEAGVALAGIIFHMNRRYIKSARFLTIRDDSGNDVVLPVNIAQQSQEYERVKFMQIPNKYLSETATVMGEDNNPRVVTQEVAAEMQANDPSLQVELSINDISYGNAEVSVEIKPVMSQGDKIVFFQNLKSINAITTYDLLKQIGIEGAEEIVERANAENQQLQAGAWVMNTPLASALYSQPQLFQFVSAMVQKEIQAEEPNKPKKSTKKKKTDE